MELHTEYFAAFWALYFLAAGLFMLVVPSFKFSE